MDMIDCDTRQALQRLSREQMKQKLLRDVLFDINVSRLEGWDHRDYIAELIEMLRGLI